MNRRYAFYCDESGMFNAPDMNVICPICVADDNMTFGTVDKFWQEAYPDNDWSDFHATALSKETVEHVVRRVFYEILTGNGIESSYIYHENKTHSQSDFYISMLIHYVLWRCRELMKRHLEDARSHPGECVHLQVALYLAERVSINTKVLETILSNEMKEKIRRFKASNGLAPDQMDIDFKVYYAPARDIPFIQISDALSHIVRAFLKQAPISEDIGQLLETLPGYRIKAETVNGRKSRKWLFDLTRKYAPTAAQRPKPVAIVIQSPPEKKPEKSPEPIEPIADVMLRSLTEGFDRNPSNPRTPALGRAVDQMRKLFKPYRMAEFDRLLELTRDTIRNRRIYRLGVALTELLYELISAERETGEWGEELLDVNDLKIADLYLTAQNHIGDNKLDDPRIRQAMKLTEKLCNIQRHWELIGSFQTHLDVNCQNSFLFEQAVENATPNIQFFERQFRNPYTGHGVRSYEIGAMFGTFAQSLAFSAHCRFFTEGVSALSMLDDALMYSMMADEHFETPEDHERQTTYRAHTHMQRFVLTGRADALVEAADALESDNRNHVYVEEFLRLFPDKAAVNYAYRLHALMKLSYLQQRSPEFLEKLSEVFVRNSDNIPADHPMEQILPYAVLLCRHEPDRRRLMSVFDRLRFSRNIVGTIRQILGAQIEYDRDGAVTAQTRDQILQGLPDGLKVQWHRYRIAEALEKYCRPVSGRHIGPMEVLPFNYA